MFNGKVSDDRQWALPSDSGELVLGMTYEIDAGRGRRYVGVAEVHPDTGTLAIRFTANAPPQTFYE